MSYPLALMKASGSNGVEWPVLALALSVWTVYGILDLDAQKITRSNDRSLECLTCLRLYVVTLGNGVEVREHQLSCPRFMGNLAALACVQMGRIGPVCRKRTIQHREIHVAAEPHERRAILRIP